MKRQKGGHQRNNKQKGRNHRKPAIPNGVQLLNGKVNESSGKWVDIFSSNLDMQVKGYYSRQQQVAIIKNGANKVARAKKGHKQGWLVKPGTGRYHHA